MFNQPIIYQPMINQNLSAFYANYVAMQQKMTQNQIYQNSTNFNSIISYAVSIDFKNFQTQYLLQEMKKQLFNTQIPQSQNKQNILQSVTEKTQGKNQKNLKSKSDQVDKFQTIQFTDLSEKSQKEEPKSKAITLDQSSEKLQFDDCSIKENKNIVKKFKKSSKSEKLKDLPLIDLVDFAEIKKECFGRTEIQKIKDNLLARQVQNWNEIQKSRRNEKLQLRRIMY